MIKLPTEHRDFPRSTGTLPPANAWGSQWKQLRARIRPLVRARGGLRKLDER
jgi:hypothetical protein